MKIKLAILTGFLTITFCSVSFGWCEWGSCHEQAGYKDTYCSTCQCTDTNYGKNDCMSLSDYCDVFGNVGGR